MESKSELKMKMIMGFFCMLGLNWNYVKMTSEPARGKIFPLVSGKSCRMWNGEMRGGDSFLSLSFLLEHLYWRLKQELEASVYIKLGLYDIVITISIQYKTKPWITWTIYTIFIYNFLFLTIERD